MVKRFIALSLALAIVAASCGGAEGGADEPSTPTTEASTTTTQQTTATTQPTTTPTHADTTTTEASTTTVEDTTTTAEAETVLTGLAITSVVFGDSVVVTNNTNADVDLTGWWLCNRPAYVELVGTLSPGESIEINAVDLGGLSADDGEVGLYNARDFGNSGAMQDYVAWGSGGGRESVAVGAGLWIADAAAPNDGAGIVRVADAAAAESWESS